MKIIRSFVFKGFVYYPWHTLNSILLFLFLESRIEQLSLNKLNIFRIKVRRKDFEDTVKEKNNVK